MLPEPDSPPEPTKREWVGFWSMIVQQTQNAFNDKAAQFTLVPLAGAIGFLVPVWPGVGVGLETFAGILIALPFILFAPIMGWLSDRFSKRDVMLGAAVMQLLILGGMFLALHLRSMGLALGAFFALAVQSAFFSPAKIGINKELVGSKHLGFASAIQQAMAMLAMLVGQIIAGVVFDHRWKEAGGGEDAAWQAASGPMLLLTLSAIPAILLAWIVPRTPSQRAEPFTGSVAIRHFVHLRDLWGRLELRRASFGVAFFWGFAAFINLWSIKVAKQLTEGGEGFGTLQSWFMAAAGLGMVAGFAVSSFLLRRRTELGWVPLAGMAMTLTALGLTLVDPTGSLAIIKEGGHPLRAALHPESGPFLWLVALLAFFGAIFLAPLNAWMQDIYPPDKRGELQSAVNLQDCLAGILAFGVIEVLFVLLRKTTNLGELAIFRIELALLGAGCGAMTWYIVRLMPGDLVRVIALAVLGVFYRIRPIQPENLPATGGVLLLPNHVTWADAFFITAASPRPVRFVMDAVYMKKPAIRWFCKLFHTVPLALGKPREAMRTAAEALAQGDVVCFFPEGQLTRTGTLRELKRGFELIARQGGAPVVPLWMDGAWGSVFSFERNRYFTKLPHRFPYGIQVAFGHPITPAEARMPRIRQGLLDAATASLEARLARWQRQPHPEARANGHQIGLVNALLRRARIARLDRDPEADALAGIDAFASMHRSRISRHSAVNDHQELQWFGGDALREALADHPRPGAKHQFFDFGSRALEPLDIEGWIHLPCLAIDGVVVAMSMPESKRPHAGSNPQPGSKPGSLGILLPGFSVREKDGDLHLGGPSLPAKGLILPGHTLDEEGFLHPPARMPEERPAGR
jgi:acyl-[acyl-carrier-protein]-phospholipid O-acyltransferase/long-chain-fatty-acid--[acyl-carrier-protein] ligase